MNYLVTATVYHYFTKVYIKLIIVFSIAVKSQNRCMFNITFNELPNPRCNERFMPYLHWVTERKHCEFEWKNNSNTSPRWLLWGACTVTAVAVARRGEDLLRRFQQRRLFALPRNSVNPCAAPRALSFWQFGKGNLRAQPGPARVYTAPCLNVEKPA